eukprot:TRINITY_DN71873_c0_g1_i1.p1 TRINITY_DN71873_c0_g1~~TRINITY_DN71873_c0_g1_i1.p1  ORF type:complete len:234 (+),score=13.42 TRINITY_DN71873_c0_g1_i1:3-704(+)
MSYGGLPGAPAPAASSPYGVPIPPPSTAFYNNWFATYYTGLDTIKLYQLWAWFNYVDTDKSQCISVKELATMPMPGIGPYAGKPLGREAASSLIRMFDSDGTLTMDFYEYAAFFGFIEKMNVAFFTADRDRGGSLDFGEIEVALKHAGMSVGRSALVAHWKANVGDSVKSVNFGQFMQIISNICVVRSRFQMFDTDRDGKLDMDQVLEVTSVLQKRPKPEATPGLPPAPAWFT